MFAKPRATSFIDNLIIEVREAFAMPLLFSLRNEDGKICCKTEKKSHTIVSSLIGRD
jgi:hypothetical protein